MSKVRDFIESGILEMYVMDQTTPEENKQVEEMAALNSEIEAEIEAISIALERFAMANAKQPNPMIAPMLLAKIDYMNRMRNGEQPSFPPALHSGSIIADYGEWISRKDLEPIESVKDAYASIIGYTPEMTTLLVWLAKGAPPETHTSEHERFLILEGSCDITIDETTHSLKRGDVLMIPLHKPHYVKVTSDCACKIILQRAAA